MAKTSKLLQLKDIWIRDVRRRILCLCTKLKTNYSETSHTPTLLLGKGSADDIMSELFGNDMDSTLVSSCSSNWPDIIDLEEALKPHQSSVPPGTSDIPDIPLGRSTRGLNLSSKYTELLSRNKREELTQETNKEFEIALSEVEARVIAYWSWVIVRIDVERTYH